MCVCARARHKQMLRKKAKRSSTSHKGEITNAFFSASGTLIKELTKLQVSQRRAASRQLEGEEAGGGEGTASCTVT